MALTSGQVNPADYPAGFRQLLTRQANHTAWDAGATTWDTGATRWDGGRLGARRTAYRTTRQPKYTPIFQDATTWDGGLTTYDTGPTSWDRHLVSMAPADRYTATLKLHQQYGAQYDALDSWKQVRWNVCGIARGLIGRTLYLRCCHEQATPLGKQPISPCSRRVTNPLASPFDWTP